MSDKNDEVKEDEIFEQARLDIQHFQMILENMDGAFLVTESDETDTQVVYTSQSMLGASNHVQQPSRSNVWGAVLPEDIAPLKNAIWQAVRTGAPLDYTHRVLTPNGQIEWRHLRGTHLPSQKNGKSRMLHVVTDITKQKEIEAQLRERDSVIEFAMGTTDINLWYFDYETSRCLLTPSCQRVHEMIGVETLENFPECLIKMGYIREDCIESIRKSYDLLRATRKPLSLDLWMRKADGSGWWCEREVLSPLIGADGRVTRGIGIGKNITAEKEMQEKFRAFQSYRILAEKNTLLSVRMNLSTGWCGDYVNSTLLQDVLPQMDTVDGFFCAGIQIICNWEGDTNAHLCQADLLKAFAEGQTSVSQEYRCQIRRTTPFWVRLRVDMIKNPNTGEVEAMCYAMDVDYEKKMQYVVDTLLSADYEFLGLIDVQTDKLMVFGSHMDDEGAAQNGGDYPKELSRIFKRLIVEEYWEEGLRTMARTNVMQELERGETYVCSFPAKDTCKHKAGRKQWKFAYLDESKSQILLTRTDITDIYTAERDALTGIYNKQAFFRHARAALDHNPDIPFVLLRCDIDRFKAYNDAYGVQAGDRLLAEFGKAMWRNTWPEFTVFGHIEADHFCVLLPRKSMELGSIATRYYNWIETLTPGYRLISSVGVYEVTDPSVEISLMCDRALLALRTVKGAYKNKIAWYDEGMRHKLIEEQELIDEMEQALKEQQFILHFQPQINYDNGKIIGAEALVRWQHPQRGLIMPGAFIPLFEKNGFILRLDAYVWEKACMQLRTWMDQSPELVVPVSVNISRCDIFDDNLCEKLQGLVEKYSIPPQLLKLEITESAYMENQEQLLTIAKQLQAYGFTVEMDDFGAGYSSLNTLKDVPVDVLKLDMQFLSKGWDDGRGGLILSSIIRMARWLGIPVIAEGVETHDQAQYLQSLSCSYMQGYLFAKPMPAHELELRLKEGAGALVESMKAHREIDPLWDPNSYESLLFNRLVGGAAILDCAGQDVELLRANDLFYKELGITREVNNAAGEQGLDRFCGVHRQTYLAMIQSVMETEQPAECEVQRCTFTPESEPIWIHNRVCFLSRNKERCLLYLEVRNISKYVMAASTAGCPAAFSDQELERVAKQSGILICRYNLKNRTLERFGIASDLKGTHKSLITDLGVSSDTAEEFGAFFAQIHGGVPQGRADLQLQLGEKGLCWYHGDYSLIYDQQGAADCAIITFYDISEKRERQIAAQKWRAGLSSLLSGAMLYAEINLSRNTVEQLEQNGGQLPGIVAENLETLASGGVFGAMDAATLKEYQAFFDRKRLLGLYAEGVKEDHFTYCLTQKEETFWVRASVVMCNYPHSEDVMAIVSYAKIEDHVQALKQLTHMAYHDALTGILNREGIDQQAESMIANYNSKNTTSVILIDLDDFKQVNDRLGHQSGDLVLKQVATSLQGAFQDIGAVGRIGGDEFIVMLSGNYPISLLGQKAHQLLETTKLELGEKKQIAISISIGIAYGRGKMTFEKLYRVADVALYTAKKAGKCQFHMVNADTNQEQTFRGQRTESDIISLQTLLKYATPEQTIQSRTPYEALLESIPGGVLILTLGDTLRLTHCNDWQMKRFGYTLEELELLQARDALAVLHPDDEPVIAEILQQIKNQQVDAISTTYRLRHRNGTYGYVQLNAVVTERTAKEIIMYGIQTDVDQMMRMQEALVQARQQQESLMEAIPGGVIMVSGTAEKFSVRHCNNWQQRHFGFTEQEVEEMEKDDPLVLLHPEDRLAMELLVKRVAAGEDKSTLVYRLRHKNGTYQYVSLDVVVATRTKEKIVAYGMQSDMQGLMQLKEELNHARKEQSAAKQQDV